MHLLSKHPSNTARQKKEVLVKSVEGKISFDELVKLEKINLEPLLIRSEDSDEYGAVTIIYYERDETDEEYQYRIKCYQNKDKEYILRILAEYRAMVFAKSEIQELFKESPPRIPFDSELLNTFLEDIGTITQISDNSYEKGLAAGRVEVEEIKSKLKNKLAELGL